MYKVNGTSILLTRGDTFKAKVRIFYDNDVEYIPVEGDLIKFALKRTPKDNDILVKKIIPIDTCELRIEAEDTKSLDFGDYRYDISIKFASDDSVYTFITNSKLKLTEEIG